MALMRNNKWLLMLLVGQAIFFTVFVTNCAKNVQVPIPQQVYATEVKIALALNGVSRVCNDTLNLVNQMMPTRTEDRDVIVNTIVTVVKANIAARRVLETYSKQPVTTQAELIGAMRPVIVELAKALDAGLLGIKNPETKKQFQIWLIGIGSAITVAQTALEVQS